MATEVFWNDAAAPSGEEEGRAVEWIVMIARQIGLSSVTAANKGEWLWRYAFAQAIRCRPFGGKWGYGDEIERLQVILDRFRSATLRGRVADQDREQFVGELVRLVIDAAREEADCVFADADAIA
jgi:hypothetical protein